MCLTGVWNFEICFQARIAADLIELRNKSVFAFFMINALFVLIVFLLQLNKDSIHVQWPFGVRTNITYVEETSEVSQTLLQNCSSTSSMDCKSFLGVLVDYLHNIFYLRVPWSSVYLKQNTHSLLSLIFLLFHPSCHIYHFLISITKFILLFFHSQCTFSYYFYNSHLCFKFHSLINFIHPCKFMYTCF